MFGFADLTEKGFLCCNIHLCVFCQLAIVTQEKQKKGVVSANGDRKHKCNNLYFSEETKETF